MVEYVNRMAVTEPLSGILTDGARVKADDRAHVFHSWSAQALIDPLPVASARGSYFTDYEGKRYLDFSSQLVNVNLGSQHPKLVAAIQEQAARLCFIQPSFANEARSEAARLIAEVAPGDLNRIFFTNGGTESTENALRMARLHTGRFKVLSAYRSFHGATAGALSMTGEPRRWASEPGMPGVVRYFGPYLYRSQFYSDSPEQETERGLEHLRDLITFEGPHTVAALILEPVVGANGILVPPPGYLAGVRALCDEFGIVMIADEVMTGFGRCGEWFAVDHWEVTPDLIAFSKGVNSGSVPLGGVLINDAINETFQTRPYPGGLTQSGNPLACGSAVASINIIKEEGVIEHARALGADVLGPELRNLADRHPSIGEVRGLGVFWALELVRNRETRQPLVPFNATGRDAAPINEFAAECKRLGLWPTIAGNRLHVVPPCNATAEEVREGVAILDEALKVADKYYESAAPTQPTDMRTGRGPINPPGRRQHG